MAMLHPSDQDFAKSEPVSLAAISSLFHDRLRLVPTEITTPSSSQGLYHKVYFVTLPNGDGRWAGKQVVLRVARKAFTKIKIENEVAIIKLVRKAGVPAPEIVFFSSDATRADNLLDYEYICLERISYPSLADTWQTMSLEALSRVLDQFVDIFIKMFDIDLPGGGVYGGLRLDENKRIVSGPVLEETMWQLPDIDRYFHAEPYNLTSETFVTLSPTGSYRDYAAYISAFLSSYHHVISIHPSAEFLRHLLVPLHCLIGKLNADSENAESWVKKLREGKGLKGRLWHRDLHFGNILADREGNIQAVIDWEFSGIGPSFAKTSSPLRNCLYFISSQETAPEAPDLAALWPPLFLKRLSERSPAIAAAWNYESNPDLVLGKEGRALSDVREYLRSCLEVGVRGWGNVEKARGDWMQVVEAKLGDLGCL